MIIGIRLKHFQKILAQGENAKHSLLTNYLLLQKSTKVWKTKDILELTYDEFVTLEMCLENSDFYNFCRIFVRKKWWQVVYVHNLETILKDFGEQKAKLIEKYTWVFNPPQYGEPQKETIGTELRKDFVNEFGTYIVLMDLVCKGDITKYKEVERWKVEEFFFWANYISGQKIIETVK